jgi:hypothetical protein
MGEPVDYEADFAETRGNLRPVTYRAYQPATDDHAAGVECLGDRGPKRVDPTGVQDGGVPVTRAEWTLGGLESRPTMQSLVVDGAEEWVIDGVSGFGPWDVSCHLS